MTGLICCIDYINISQEILLYIKILRKDKQPCCGGGKIGNRNDIIIKLF